MMMGWVGLFHLAVIVFDILAWPLFAIWYPLCASIKAIETKSNSDIQKLITYWVSFSLILLFERAFENLLEWLPYWPYIKLMVVYCLVTPNFDGSLYVYKHLVHPCLSVDPQTVINRIIKLKVIFFKEDNLLAEMERYIQENGPDALENLISLKSRAAGTNLVVKEIMTLAEVDLQKFDKTKVAHPSIIAVDAAQKNDAISASQVRHIEPNLPLAENKASAPPEIKDIATAGEAGTDLPEICPSKQVQRQWTCAICQVTAHSETVLNAHLQGRRHKAACEKLNAKKQTPKSEASFAATGKKSNVTSLAAAATCKDQPGMRLPSENIPMDWTCSICNITAKTVTDVFSHLQGKRHKVACEQLKARVSDSKVSPASLGKASSITERESQEHASNSATTSKIGKYVEKNQPGEQENMKNKGVEILNNMWLCKLCNISCSSQVNMDSHLGGQKHLSRIRGLNAQVAGGQA